VCRTCLCDTLKKRKSPQRTRCVFLGTSNVFIVNFPVFKGVHVAKKEGKKGGQKKEKVPIGVKFFAFSANSTPTGIEVRMFESSIHKDCQHGLDTRWPRPIGCLQLQVIFCKRAMDYRALLRKTTYKEKTSYGSPPPCIKIPSDTTLCGLQSPRIPPNYPR